MSSRWRKPSAEPKRPDLRDPCGYGRRLQSNRVGGDFDPGAASLIADGGGDTGYDGGFDPAADGMISNGDITDVL